MTPEMVEYFRIMLMVGIRDQLDAAFDHALETEDPLSDLTLSLTTCISDDNQVLSVLREYTLEHTIDEQAVCDRILDDLRGRYLAGNLSRADVVGVLCGIVRNLNKFWEEPWMHLMDVSFDLELYEDGVISEESFNQAFDSWLLHGKRQNGWERYRT